MHTSYYLIPVVSTLIGWGTNVIAVKMLFHPREPINIGFMTLQGAVPKRKKALAGAIAKLCHEELYSSDELVEHLRGMKFDQDIDGLVDARLDSFISRLTGSIPMASMFLKGPLLDTLKGQAKQEFMKLLPDIQETVVNKVKNEIDLHAFVEEKVMNFSVRKLEAITMRVATQELKTIERLGGLLGLLIGLLQLLAMTLFF